LNRHRAHLGGTVEVLEVRSAGVNFRLLRSAARGGAGPPFTQSGLRQPHISARLACTRWNRSSGQLVSPEMASQRTTAPITFLMAGPENKPIRRVRDETRRMRWVSPRRAGSLRFHAAGSWLPCAESSCFLDNENFHYYSQRCDISGVPLCHQRACARGSRRSLQVGRPSPFQLRRFPSLSC